MRIHCKIVAIAVCFGVFLLLYFLGGNAADEPPLREVEKDNYFQSSYGPENVVSVKLPKKSPEEPQKAPKPPRVSRKNVKISARGSDVNAKLR